MSTSMLPSSIARSAALAATLPIQNLLAQGGSAASTPQTAPGTAIAFAPELIPNLVEDHVALLALFGAITVASDKGDFEGAKSRLHQFRSAVTRHLLTENIRLYIYLQRSLRSDPVSGESIVRFRTEMNGIAKAVMEFIDKYTKATPWTAARLAEFRTELSIVGEILAARIQSEERDLYPLYLPQHQYQSA